MFHHCADELLRVARLQRRAVFICMSVIINVAASMFQGMN